MGFFIFMFIKMCWWMFLVSMWACWAMVALPVMLIASATGHHRMARDWQRSMNWHHVFHVF